MFGALAPGGEKMFGTLAPGGEKMFGTLAPGGGEGRVRGGSSGMHSSRYSSPS